MEPFFSIIVPVYNVEDYLDDCYLSISSQSFSDYEIIFVNDGSTDYSGEKCDEICKHNKRAITIHKENGGLSDARNVGISLSKGKYIVLLDSDDMLNEKALESLHRLINENEFPDVLINRIKFFSEDPLNGKECKYKFSNELNKSSIPKCFQTLTKLDDYVPAAWTLVVKKDHIVKKDLYFVKGLLHEDEQWTPRVVLSASTVAFNNNCFYLYRQEREGSITQVKNSKREIDKLWISNDLYNESKKSKYSMESKEALVNRATDLYWGVLVRTYQYKENESDFNKLLSNLANINYIFKLSKNKKYVFANFLIGILGVKNTTIFLNRAASKRI
ncbi:MAG: glycosyltransferase [Solibacillus sp.]